MNIKIAKILSIITVLVSFLVMAGWVFDIQILKSILPQWVTMKFSTALSFFFSGAILYFVARTAEEKIQWAQVILPISSLIILLLMFTLLVSVFIGIRTGIEDLFVKEVEGAIATNSPGRPSAGTMISFIIIGIIANIVLSHISRWRQVIFYLGVIVTLSGLIALIGYIINQPSFYYSIEGISSAMAVHTAILFVFLGAGFILTGQFKKESLPVQVGTDK